MKFAPRLPLRLVEEIERLAASRLSSAEICRRVGEKAELLGAPRPSYQRVRALVCEIRGRPHRPSTTAVLLDVAFRARPPDAVVQHLAEAPRNRAGAGRSPRL
jgi:hypothetical protein